MTEGVRRKGKGVREMEETAEKKKTKITREREDREMKQDGKG